MPLFQSAVLNKYLKQQDPAQVAAAYALFTAYFHHPERQQNILNAKEEQFQEGFLRELFGRVLGYTINPDPGFQLTTELKNETGSKKADGAILQDGKALAVIELKGTDTTDLASINAQAFSYKNHHTHCVYVVTSNFQKLRFYIDNAVDWLEFDLFTLSAEQFRLLWLCLQRDNLLGGVPKKVKAESVQEEEQVTKRLYKDYSAFKNALWQDLCANHADAGGDAGPAHDKLLLYKKTQKLLDRFLFVLFGEDKGLLPPNTLRGIVDQWQKLRELDEYRPLYERCQKYFGYLNSGHKSSTQDIFAYNGGLFKPDELLDHVRISDAVLEEHLGKLTKYDFASEVDVNILGHIFEHSLNEIEAITAELEGRALDNKKTKRKKDGVFYTPKYITKYIVENTVGRLCAEKKAELGIDDEAYARGRKGRQKKTVQELDTKLDVYRDWLLRLTICDPACGSGAFLNQALDFLIAEHRYVDELESKLLGQSIVFKDIGDHILERNIYGVDINEESVEIARLSLWLRTATKGRKLNDLSGNIKCGNSLIDDPAVAGAKAFDWRKEFPQVFDPALGGKGGFDVVVGNPPYVRPRSQTEEEKSWLVANYEAAENQFDLYHLFIEKAEKIRSKQGVVSMILPDAFLANESSIKLRKFILEKCHIERIIDCGDNVFAEAAVEVLIYVFTGRPSQARYFQRSDTDFIFKNEFDQSSFWSNKNLNFTVTLSSAKSKCFTKVQSRGISLGSSFDVMGGIKEYQVGKGKPPQTQEDKDLGRFNATTKKDETFIREVRGKHLDRFALHWENEYVSYGPWIAEPRNPIYFTGPRILMRQIPGRNSLIACYTDEDYVVDQSAYVIKPHSDDPLLTMAVLGILNSRLLFWFYQNENNEFDLLFPKIKSKEIKSLPIAKLTESAKAELAAHANSAHQAAMEHYAVRAQLLNLLRSKYALPTLSRALENWPSLEFKGFLAELKKAKVSLSLAEEAEWLGYFTEQKAKAQALQAQIAKTDREIDALVYQLYGLTEEEVRVVEGRG